MESDKNHPTKHNKKTFEKVKRDQLIQYLKEGVYDFFQCDFSGEDLSEITFSNGKTKLDFQNSNFDGANLSKTNLFGCLMTGCSFQESDLSNSRIEEVDWSKSDFRAANFEGATIILTNMSRCFFGGANLSSTRLFGVNFSRSIMFQVTFNNTILTYSNFKDVREATMRLVTANVSNLGDQLNFFSEAGNKINDATLNTTVDFFAKRSEHLVSLKVENISMRIFAEINDIIDFMRISKISNKKLQQFKKDCIDSINRPSIFISYSSKDIEATKLIHRLLSKTGISVWFAPYEMKAGGGISDQLNNAIDKFSYVLPVLSENSINSKWVEHEILRAKHREKEKCKILYPVRISSYEKLKLWELKDPVTRHDFAKEILDEYIPDFSMWRDTVALQNEFLKFARDLKIISVQDTLHKT